jgi:hypothetical protein
MSELVGTCVKVKAVLWESGKLGEAIRPPLGGVDPGSHPDGATVEIAAVGQEGRVGVRIELAGSGPEALRQPGPGSSAAR